eukprot:7389692-Prymnesium_polylepis.1
MVVVHGEPALLIFGHLHVEYREPRSEEGMLWLVVVLPDCEDAMPLDAELLVSLKLAVRARQLLERAVDPTRLQEEPRSEALRLQVDVEHALYPGADSDLAPAAIGVALGRDHQQIFCVAFWFNWSYVYVGVYLNISDTHTHIRRFPLISARSENSALVAP